MLPAVNQGRGRPKGGGAACRMLAAMLDRAREYSAVKGQPATTARGAMGGAEAVVRREIVAGRIHQLPRLLPDFIYVATVPFLGQEGAMRLHRRGREMLRDTAWALED